ncbi:TonB-dependent receptor [Ferruginibacter lapsinanis]|uniref:TonB-dependent receptor n=1 Tax=Ferruginibacter lapsinanis TaxID=563172 RepID=UPI001E38A09A|nr:TonB-dependent receptor [Ferruginibacter lapsinanis]UEG50355.1 TonB-dependent receptor [Ferruginibacter lapsinanis]
MIKITYPKIKILFLLIAVISISTAFSQENTGTITGVISTADGKPAEGVTILLKDNNKNTIADNAGNFKIKNVPAGKQTVIVSLVGYDDVEKITDVISGKITVVDIKLSLSNKELSQVVVVANKNSFKTNRTSNSLRLQTPILEIPQNIQVVTSKTMNDQQIFDMLEGVTRNVSGATRVEHWDNYARITMRGSNVAAFRNGLNVSTAWGPLVEDMSMVERIEFVKGPAGFMLSNTDPSGFYNVVTKKPSGRNKGELNVSVGSFDLYRAALDLDGKLSKNGKLLYRLNVVGQTKGSHRQYDFNDRVGIVPVLKYWVDDKSSITLEYAYQKVQTSPIGSNYSFSKRGLADLPITFTTAEANLPKTDMIEKNVSAIFEHKINNDWKFTAQTSYIRYDQEGISLWPQGFDASNDSLMQRGAGNWDVLGLTKAGQMFVNGEATTGNIGHTILAGIDLSSKDYYHDWSQSRAIGTPINIYAPVHGQSTPIVAFDRTLSVRERGVRYYNAYSGLYAQDELSFMDNKLRLTLAGRYTAFKTSDPYSGAVDHKKITPRVGVSYSIDKNTAVYAVYDKAMLENFGSDWQQKSFDPIIGTNVEAGIKKDWYNGKWNSTISAYQITRTNVQTADPDHLNSLGLPYNRQTGEQQTRGVEVDIKGQLIRNLDVIVNYAFTEAKITEDTDPKVIGNQLPGSSKHVQNAWLNYRVDKGIVNGLGFSLGYQYQVKRAPWYVFDNSVQSLPDYFRVDGGVSYTKEKLSFNVVVNNILNKYLYSGAFYNWGPYYYWQAEPGTNVRFTVGYKF